MPTEQQKQPKKKKQLTYTKRCHRPKTSYNNSSHCIVDILVSKLSEVVVKRKKTEKRAKAKKGKSARSGQPYLFVFPFTTLLLQET